VTACRCYHTKKNQFCLTGFLFSSYCKFMQTSLPMVVRLIETDKIQWAIFLGWGQCLFFKSYAVLLGVGEICKNLHQLNPNFLFWGLSHTWINCRKEWQLNRNRRHYQCVLHGNSRNLLNTFSFAVRCNWFTISCNISLSLLFLCCCTVSILTLFLAKKNQYLFLCLLLYYWLVMVIFGFSTFGLITRKSFSTGVTSIYSIYLLFDLLSFRTFYILLLLAPYS